MRRAAGEIAAAPDLPSAAAIAPRLVRTCSHESSNAVVTFAREEAPSDAADLSAQSKTEGLDARATLYGELLSTCAGCHQLVRPAPVPGPCPRAVQVWTREVATGANGMWTCAAARASMTSASDTCLNSW